MAAREKEDLVLLYFSGHGITIDGGELFLAMANTKRDVFESTALPTKFVLKSLRLCKARRQIVLLDCCYSGAFLKGHISKADDTVNSTALFKIDDVFGRGQAILTACDDIQYAWEGGELTKNNSIGSLFTQAMIEGLSTGDADLDSDGDISVEELHTYVFRYLQDKKSLQNPRKWIADAQGEIIIAKIRAER